MIDLPSLKPINVGGREINAYLIVGVVVLLAVSGISLSFNLAPTSTFDSGLRGLDLEIFKKIGVGLKINTLAEATQSIGSIAQDLEKARGTVSNLNERFAGKETGQPSVSGLVGLANTSPGIVETLISIVAISLAVMIFARSKR